MRELIAVPIPKSIELFWFWNKKSRITLQTWCCGAYFFFLPNESLDNLLHYDNL